MALKTFSDWPPKYMARSAPVRLKGSASRIVKGWRKLLNWEARTMYAAASPPTKAKASAELDSCAEREDPV